MSDKVLLLPGDGIGPIVTAAAEKVLSMATDSVEIVHGMIGKSAFEETGQYLPHETMDLLDECKIILSGPVFTPESGVDPLKTLKVQLDLYARARYFRTLAPDLGVDGLEMVLWGSNNNVSSEITEVTELDGVTISKYIKSTSYSRMMSLALSDVEIRKLERVTCLRRPDFFPISSGMFADTFQTMFPADVYETRILNVKDWASHLLKTPSLDQCIICVDMYSHVVSGMLGGLTGYDHLCPTCYIGDEYRLYQPRHKATIEGLEDKYINPTASILSSATILRDLGLKDEAESIVNAVKETYVAGERCPDVGGNLTTDEFVEKIISRV